jgi:hypothetical protein
VQRKTRSILDELADLTAKPRNVREITESRAVHVIQGAVNLLNYVRENFDPDTAADLEKRLYNSIRSADSSKFLRGIKKVKP